MVGHRVVRADPRDRGRVLRQGLAVFGAATDKVVGTAQAASDQVLGWRIGQAQGDVGIATAEVGKGIGGGQLQRKGRVLRHEIRQRW